MDKTAVFKVSTLLLILLFAALLPLVKGGYDVSVTWGSTYHPTDNDPDPNWYAQYEEPEHYDTCDYITYLIWGDYAGESWIGNNFYGSSTTDEYVYQCSSSVEAITQYDSLMTFHVGDMYPDWVYGCHWEIVGYWYDEENMQWIPIWDWVYEGPERHYAYYGSQGSSNGIEDYQVYGHTGPKHRFTFIYTCANGGLIDTDDDGDYDCYGYVDTQYGSGIVGMPYAWTQCSGLSWDGYGDPDYSGYAYIGFENI